MTLPLVDACDDERKNGTSNWPARWHAVGVRTHACLMPALHNSWRAAREGGGWSAPSRMLPTMRRHPTIDFAMTPMGRRADRSMHCILKQAASRAETKVASRQAAALKVKQTACRISHK